MKFKNWFWGLFFIVAACLVIVNQLGYLTGFNIFTLIASIFLIAIIITLLEAISIKGLDNITVPISSCLLLLMML